MLKTPSSRRINSHSKGGRGSCHRAPPNYERASTPNLGPSRTRAGRRLTDLDWKTAVWVAGDEHNYPTPETEATPDRTASGLGSQRPNSEINPKSEAPF